MLSVKIVKSPDTHLSSCSFSLTPTLKTALTRCLAILGERTVSQHHCKYSPSPIRSTRYLALLCASIASLPRVRALRIQGLYINPFSYSISTTNLRVFSGTMTEFDSVQDSCIREIVPRISCVVATYVYFVVLLSVSCFATAALCLYTC